MNRIIVKNLSKTFYIAEQLQNTFIEKLMFKVKTRAINIFKDVTFSVKEGEFFGIIGRNGAGKSTLLKIVAGIYDQDGGIVKIKGSFAPFLELGVGFHPELTARENAILNGIILGLSRKYILGRIDKIFEFAELTGFEDVRLKNFSSGMRSRLAFSIAFEADVDIYLLDEVFAVGDIWFQKKCITKLIDLKKRGKTVVVVSHSMEFIESFCDRAALLDKGKILEIGEPKKVIRRYINL